MCGLCSHCGTKVFKVGTIAVIHVGISGLKEN